MSVRKTIPEREGVFFITFTCYKWLNLFEITNSYDLVYKWFDVLISKKHQITGYVIMPNHLHVLIALRNSTQNINTIVSNAKRFMAYGIIKRLNIQGSKEMIEYLKSETSKIEKKRNQVHRVFEKSFDVKLCLSEKFIEQKLNYIHMNPCSKKWSLVNHPLEYKHSSMSFYENYYKGIKSKLTPYTALFEED